MKKIYLLILILTNVSCSQKSGKPKTDFDNSITNNIELTKIYELDQSDRQTDKIDGRTIYKRDSIRQVRVYQLLDSNKVRTSQDYHNAAMIFQHGRDSVAYGKAVELIKKSIELDSTSSKWLLAAAIDRYLLSKNEPQIYGTQYQKKEIDSPWKLGEIDTTKITDKQRIEFGVETLAEQKEKVKKLNRENIK
jgi:hypothetical protein